MHIVAQLAAQIFVWQQVCLLNYKRSGDKFWNQFYLAPVIDENNHVSHYMGIQSDVSELMNQIGAGETEGKSQLLVTCHSAVALYVSVVILFLLLVDGLAEANSLDSTGSVHQACFPDVVTQEQHKAEGVNNLLTSWRSSNGEL